MADDWRVTVTFRDEADVQQAVRSVREHEVEDDVRSQLGHRIVWGHLYMEDVDRSGGNIDQAVRRMTTTAE